MTWTPPKAISLESIMDANATTPAGWNEKGALFAEEVERYLFDFKVGICISTIPRRLGIEMSPDLLKADKQLGRRSANIALVGLQWNDVTEPWMFDWAPGGGARTKARADKEAYGEAARRAWTTWYYDRVTWLSQHIPRVARWAVTTGQRKDGNVLCTRLGSEAKQMELMWMRTAPMEWREQEDVPADDPSSLA